MENFKITAIQLFDYKENMQTTEDGDYKTRYSYSANVVINDKFIVQIASSSKIDIPSSIECAWSSDKNQDYAHKNIDIDAVIDQTGIKIEREWLVKNGAEVMNPENKPGETLCL